MTALPCHSTLPFYPAILPCHSSLPFYPAIFLGIFCYVNIIMMQIFILWLLLLLLLLFLPLSGPFLSCSFKIKGNTGRQTSNFQVDQCQTWHLPKEHLKFQWTVGFQNILEICEIENYGANLFCVFQMYCYPMLKTNLLLNAIL